MAFDRQLYRDTYRKPGRYSGLTPILAIFLALILTSAALLVFLG